MCLLEGCVWDNGGRRLHSAFQPVGIIEVDHSFELFLCSFFFVPGGGRNQEYNSSVYCSVFFRTATHWWWWCANFLSDAEWIYFVVSEKKPPCTYINRVLCIRYFYVNRDSITSHKPAGGMHTQTLRPLSVDTAFSLTKTRRKVQQSTVPARS